MPLVQALLVAEEPLAQSCGGVVVVVQVNLDLSEPGTTESSQSIEMFRLVLLEWIEESVLRRPAIAIGETAKKTRILACPAIDPCLRLVRRDVASLRFEVVGEAEEQMNLTTGTVAAGCIEHVWN
jgi:hypothetical protein